MWVSSSLQAVESEDVESTDCTGSSLCISVHQWLESFAIAAMEDPEVDHMLHLGKTQLLWLQLPWEPGAEGLALCNA